MLAVAHHTETSGIFTPAVCAFNPPSPGGMARQAPGWRRVGRVPFPRPRAASHPSPPTAPIFLPGLLSLSRPFLQGAVRRLFSAILPASKRCHFPIEPVLSLPLCAGSLRQISASSVKASFPQPLETAPTPHLWRLQSHPTADFLSQLPLKMIDHR